MPYVESSVISRVEWRAGTLSVWFRTTGRYDYAAVPEAVYLRFLRATSKGQFFSTRIRDHFEIARRPVP